jgi:hypothetical protein
MALCSLRCGLTYRRVFERSEAEIKNIASTARAAHRIEEPKAIEPKIFGPPEASLKRKRIEDEVEDFRYVRLRTDRLNPIGTVRKAHKEEVLSRLTSKSGFRWTIAWPTLQAVTIPRCQMPPRRT